MGNGAIKQKYLTKLLPSYFGNGTSTQKASQPTTIGPTDLSAVYSLLTSGFVMSGRPVWRDLSVLSYLLKCYYENPIVQTVINIKAEAFANIKYKVKDLKNGEIVSLADYKGDRGELAALLKKPNPLQSTYEWLKQFKVNYEVFGNGYSYATTPEGFSNVTYREMAAIKNLAPYCVVPILTGKWLEATELDEIISGYELTYFNGKKKILKTRDVMHVNDVNIKFDQNFTMGKSNLIALQRPISNIDIAYESRNVMGKRRGALGAWTSEKKDEAMGSLPLDETEIAKVQKAFEKYGLLDDQWAQIISPMPLKWQSTAIDTKKLMLFEEVETNAMTICNALGVPEGLVRNYKKTGTLGSDSNVDEKRLYDSTIIPESVDFMVAFNNFLRTSDFEIELLGTYDHINVLQDDKKEEAETFAKKEQTALSAFKIGAIIYNDYLTAIGMPNDPTIGMKRIWDLDEKQLAVILNNKNTQKNGN